VGYIPEQGDIIARESSFLEKSPQDILDEVIDIFIGFIE
jgi:mRNA interferase MazF